MKLTQQQQEQVRATFPEWFETELKIGTWYTYKGCNSCVSCYQGGFDKSGYGITLSGEWGVGVNMHGGYKLWCEATPEEVKSALIAEAKRRYKVGDRIKSLRNDWVQTIGEMFVNVYSPIKERNYWVVTVVAEENEWNEMCSNPEVFKNGQWASILTPEKPSLQDDIQSLKDRWPDINFTIISEGKK